MTSTDTITQRPDWANTLREKYLAGEASIFVLHGNVFDQVVLEDRAMMLQDYLSQVLFGDNKGLVYELSWSQGVRIIGGKALNVAKEGNTELPAALRTMEVSASDLVAGGVGDALRKIEKSFAKDSAALLIPYAGTMLPAGDPALLSNDERAAFTTVHRWSLDSNLAKRDSVVVIVCESVQEINPAILTSPRVSSIEIPLPTEAVRARVVRASAQGLEEDEIALLASHTSGLRAIQVERIVSSQSETALTDTDRTKLIAKLLKGQPNAAARAKKLATITAGQTEDEIIALVSPGSAVAEDASDHKNEMLRVIHARKRELIEKECAGLISFMESKHGLEAVGGNEKIKQELMDIADLMKSGNRKLAPMGLLCVGPMGAGKTFVVKSFLKEANLTGVALKNIRSKWNGATEANLERVLATVKAMGPIAVVIDESDRSFGGKEQADTDGGVSSRVMARLKEFMSDTDNRGQVLFILMTNRPDRIETDLKRPGRLDRKVPFFYCETSEERADVLRAILGRSKDGANLDKAGMVKLCDLIPNYSNADIEAVALLALDFANRRGQPLSLDLINDAIADFIPSREEDMIKLMELLAAQETSRRSLLPARFTDMSTQEINAKVSSLRHHLRDNS